MRIVGWDWFGWFISALEAVVCVVGGFVMLVWSRVVCSSVEGWLVVDVMIGAMVGDGGIGFQPRL